MSTSQQGTTVRALPEEVARASKIAEAMTNSTISRHVDGHPWTTEEVLGVAIDRGLEAMEQIHLKATA